MAVFFSAQAGLGSSSPLEMSALASPELAPTKLKRARYAQKQVIPLLLAAVVGFLMVTNALWSSPVIERVKPDFCTVELNHFAITLGRARTEVGRLPALKVVVAQHMGLYKKNEEAYVACGASKGAFKDWKRDFNCFKADWEDGWTILPLRPHEYSASPVDLTDPSFDIPHVADCRAHSLTLAATAASTEATPAAAGCALGPNHTDSDACGKENQALLEINRILSSGALDPFLASRGENSSTVHG